MKTPINSFRKGILLLFLMLAVSAVFAQQESRRLNLEQVVDIAREQSPDALGAKHRFRGSYWQYKSYKAAYLPSLGFEATIPNLNRRFTSIILPDGSDLFVRRNQATSSATLSLSQTIGFTGGQLFVSSGLERIDVISKDGPVSYMATPLNIGFRQPIFSYNRHKWERKIEPLRYKEALRQYVTDMENVSIRATSYYFDLLLAQINVEINTINFFNNDTLYKIAQGRYNLGRIAENELLQMELNVLNSDAQLEQSRIDFESAMFRFRSYLGLEGTERIELIPPLQVHNIKVDVQKALEQAKKNRPELLAYERQLLEAESNLSMVKSENRFNASLFAVYGLTQSASDLPAVYKNPLDQQQLAVGIQVPIIDWGVGRGRVKMAESSRELMVNNINQARIDFEQEVYLKVMEFNMLESQLKIALKADEIAQKRYDVSRQRYLIGRIDILELNVALQEKDLAKQRYLSALRTYWRSYYEMRRLTLYDFMHDLPLEALVEDL